MTQLGTWYALAVNAGQEKKVRERILDRLQRQKISIAGLLVVCPEEEFVVRIGAEPQRRRRMALPGCLLVHGRRFSDESLVTMTKVKGVMGFLGGDHPTPLPDSEIVKLLGDSAGSGSTSETVRRQTQSLFSVDDQVTIIEGPFSDFSGTIAELDENRGVAKVEMEIFGRLTPVEVELRSLKRR